jgi:Fur family transcriptional regulator, zinc uptake regulator
MKRGLTDNYQRVYRALYSTGAPMTAYEVLDAVRPHGISAPPTVYRALSRLVDDGLAHRLESISAYVACADPKHHHDSAVFAICNGCGKIEELLAAAIIKRLHARAAEQGFKVSGTTVELRGRCAGCQLPEIHP